MGLPHPARGLLGLDPLPPSSGRPLGVAANVLSDRLATLVTYGVMAQEAQTARPLHLAFMDDQGKEVPLDGSPPQPTPTQNNKAQFHQAIARGAREPQGRADVNRQRERPRQIAPKAHLPICPTAPKAQDRQIRREQPPEASEAPRAERPRGRRIKEDPGAAEQPPDCSAAPPGEPPGPTPRVGTGRPLRETFVLFETLDGQRTPPKPKKALIR